MDGLRAEKIQPKRISEFTEIIENNTQRDRNYFKEKAKEQKTDLESIIYKINQYSRKERDITHSWFQKVAFNALFTFFGGGGVSHLHLVLGLKIAGNFPKLSTDIHSPIQEVQGMHIKTNKKSRSSGPSKMQQVHSTLSLISIKKNIH